MVRRVPRVLWGEGGKGYFWCQKNFTGKTPTLIKKNSQEAEYQFINAFSACSPPQLCPSHAVVWQEEHITSVPPLLCDPEKETFPL